MLKIYARLEVKEALRRGVPIDVDTHGEVAIEVPNDLAKPDRELIAKHITLNDGRYILGWMYHRWSVAEATIAGVLETIAAVETDAAEKEREKAKRKAERLVNLIEAINKREQREAHCGSGKPYSWHEHRAELPYDYDEIKNDLPAAEKAKLAEWQNTLKVANERLAKIAAADWEKTKKRMEAEKAAKEKEVADWIAEHGSKRLKRLVKEGFEHDDAYADERLAKERPEWRWLEHERCDEVRNNEVAPVTDEAFAVLDKARKSVPEAALTELCQWIEATDEQIENDEADEDNQVLRWCFAAKASFMGRTIVFKEHTKWN